jgi:hypothetical protein
MFLWLCEILYAQFSRNRLILFGSHTIEPDFFAKPRMIERGRADSCGFLTIYWVSLKPLPGILFRSPCSYSTPLAANTRGTVSAMDKNKYRFRGC